MHVRTCLFLCLVYLLGFPIKRRILHHSTLLNFFIFNCGKDSFIQIEKSFSIKKRGLKKKINMH